ncbi:hypothetical protein PDESU_04905 [Pontiella desulfatans]|uniref:PEP-CTERM protein-sorting domain-containing protein n=1 Tax=Pontiella desulfatans TaxID=2750659 RepID=A0A6C2UAA0_PONDE|nr:PEP-CTERM sorting domain-containing protein [Pontiella desulfatans]VGO16314.1 hypothetical protein PDESU_04905 [Pontiella desulfatans]
MRFLAIMILLAGSACLAGATVVFDADFQGSSAGSSNLFNATVLGRNAILDNGTSVGSWADNDSNVNTLYEIADDEAGNNVMVFSSVNNSPTVANANFSSVASLAGNALTLSWDWMHTDEGGGGSGRAFIDLLDSADAVVATVLWEDGGALTVAGTSIGNFKKELLGKSSTDLSTANWDPLALQLTMTSTSLEVVTDGTVQTTLAGSFTEVAGLRFRSSSNRTYSQGGMWIDDIHADVSVIPEPATLGLFCAMGAGMFWVRRIMSL